MTTSIDEIKSLIQQHLGLPLQDLTLPANYAQLREQAVSKELADELHLLRDLSNSVDDEASFKEEFKRLCAIREKRNENKTLSYFAMPEGVCNALYWDIAKILFKPNNLIELLEILMPSIKHSFNVNLSVTRSQATNPLSYQYQINVERAQLEKLDILSEDANADLLKEYPYYLMTLQKGQAIPTKDRGCYLYRYDPEGKTHVMVVHDENHTETFDISDADIIENLDWPKEGKTTITPSNELIKLIKDAHLRPSLLTCFVVEDGELFNLEQMEKLPLDLHLQLYKRLEKHPVLKDKIYQHSDDLKQLLSHIEFAEYEGKSPRNAIREIISELTRAGKNHTGIEKVAANTVTIPLTNFRIYLDGLLKEFRQSVLQLHGSDNKKTIENILCDLEHGGEIRGCVDSAALLLQGILEKAYNATVLDKMPLVTEEQLKEINAKYHKHTISVTGYDLTDAIPKEISKPLLANFQLNNVNDYIDLLLNVPPEEYATFLGAAKLTGDNDKLAIELVEAFEQKMFNEHQRKTLLKAIRENLNKFGVNDVLKFTILIDDYENILAILNELAEKNHQEAENIGNNNDETALRHYALREATMFNRPNIVKAILDPLPKNDRLTAVNSKYRRGDTILFWAIHCGFSKVIEVILNALPKKDRIEAVNTRNKDGHLALFTASEYGYFNAIKAILGALPEKDHLAAVSATIGNITALYEAIDCGHTDIIKLILYVYPEKDRLAAVNMKDCYGKTALSTMTSEYGHPSAPSDIQTILEALPEEDQMSLLEEHLYVVRIAGRDGKTLLQNDSFAAKYREIYIKALSEDHTGVDNKQLAEFDYEHPELGLKRLQKTNDLEKEFSKFADTQQLQDNIIKIIDNLAHPRGGFLSFFYWGRDYLVEANALLNILNNEEKLVNKEISLRNLEKNNPTNPKDISLAKRLAYCYDMVTMENTNHMEPVNENAGHLSI